MKRFVLIILVCVVSINVFAQRAKHHHGARGLYEKARFFSREADNEYGSYEPAWPRDHAKDSIHLKVQKIANQKKVLECYDELLRKYPASRLRYLVQNYRSYLQLHLHDTVSAIASLKATINTRRSPYRNRAAVSLAELYLVQGQYSQALHYIDDSKKYKSGRWCGVMNAEEAISEPMLYADIYRGLHDDQNALAHLLPFIEGRLTDQSRLADTAAMLLLRTHSQADLKAQLEEAFKNYKTGKKLLGKSEFRDYHIDFLHTRIDIYPFPIFLDNPDYTQTDSLMHDMMVRSRFYKLVSE